MTTRDIRATTSDDRNFYSECTVADLTYPKDGCSVLIDMQYPESFMLVNEGNSKVYYSFNGTIDHGSLTPSTPTAAKAFDNRVISKVWFRLATSSAPTTVTVEAWARA